MKLYNRLISIFNNFSLQKKIFYSYFFLCFLLISILSVSICTFTASSLRKRNTFSLQQNFNQAVSYLSYKLDGISSTSDMLIYNISLNSILNQTASTYSSSQQVNDSKEILHLLKNIQENDDITQARIYVPDNLSYSDNGVNICPLSQAESSLWWDPLFVKKGLHLFVGQQDLEDHPYRSSDGIALLRAMYKQNDYNTLAFIVRLDVPIKTIEEILNSANFTNDSTTFLIDSEHHIIANSDHPDENLLQASSNMVVPCSGLSENTVTKVSLSSGTYMALQAGLSQSDWKIITFVPYNSFNIAILTIIRSILLVSVLLLFLAAILSKPIAHTITKRIDHLCDSMSEARKGVLMPVSGTIYQDEIGSLYENYNFMIDRINQLLAENYQIGTELKSAEYKALQSQINPHFLYNTLDMIGWLSYQNKTDEINSVVYALARFYKLSLAKGKYIVPLSDELDHVSYYIKIQEMRFHGSIRYELNVDPELLSYSIPKITLQPIVENAIFHGILEKASKNGCIRISGLSKGANYELIISDDGIGMDSEKLSELNSADIQDPDSSSGSHYGLKNIDHRIRLLYGNDYGLSFESEPMQGTHVHILLPKLHVDEVMQ